MWRLDEEHRCVTRVHTNGKILLFMYYCVVESLEATWCSFYCVVIHSSLLTSYFLFLFLFYVRTMVLLFLVSLLSLKGYACSTKNLVSSWREQWSATPGTTSPTFPFGIVTLADGTSEGHGHNMANFRSAQMAGYAF